MEAVLLLPVLVLCTLIVVQVALVWHARNIALSTARHGAQAARAYTATDADGLREARRYLKAVDPALLTRTHIKVARTATTVTVFVDGRAMAVPGLPFTLSIDAHSSSPVERFVAPATRVSQ